MEIKTKTIALGKIAEAPWNTRAKITDVSVREMAESIKADGLIQPLNVIADGQSGTEEYICFDGCRRLSALRSIGAKDAPCRVWGITEAEAKVKTVTANLQREDDNPLLAARVVCDLLDAGMPEAAIAAKFGKPVKWVERRRQLVSLASIEGADALCGKMTAAALDMIATLPKEAQAEVVAECAHILEWQDEVSTSWVRNTVLREAKDLDRARFDCAACARCAKRTGAEPDLWGDVADGKLGKCKDAGCYNRKVKEWQDEEVAKRVKDGTETVRVKYVWELDNADARSEKPTKEAPCAYVFVNSDGEVEVKYGPSKKAKVAEEARRKAERDAKRDAENAEHEREVAIAGKFADYMADEDGQTAFGQIVGKIKGPTGKQRDWMIAQLKNASAFDAWDYAGIADFVEAFPTVADAAGLTKEDTAWFYERNKGACDGDGE